MMGHLKMKSAMLSMYGSNLKKLANATARDDQMQVIRNSQFKASLVDDPLGARSSNLVHVFETARLRDPK
jgi:hypothetical protein